MRALVVVAMAALLATPAMGEMIQSGAIQVDLNAYTPGDNGVPFVPRGNVLVNPGFETGSLPPWYTSAWVVTNLDAHSGTYCAECYGNNWVRQDFDPVDVNDILSISMWSKQPEGVAFQAVDYYYGASDYDEFLVYPGVDWTFIDMTAEKRAAGMMTGIRIWGYSGGGPDPDLTRCDDVVIDVVATPVENTSWGHIKALYK